MRNKTFNLIPVSFLNSFHYCKHQVYLAGVLGIKPHYSVNRRIIKGTLVHRIIRKTCENMGDLIKDIRLAYTISKKEDRTVWGREVPVVGKTLYGIVDELWISPDGALVIEYKPSIRAYKGHKCQVMGYCFALMESLNVSLNSFEIRGKIVSWEYSSVLWEKRLSKTIIRKIKKTVAEIFDILNEKTPSNRVKSGLCSTCSYHYYCSYRGLE
jgi:CRISPR-associated protein Cas4